MQQAVCQNGGIVSSQILRKFSAMWLVPAVVETATSASCGALTASGGQRSAFGKREKDRALLTIMAKLEKKMNDEITMT